jgi:type VII secretion integral membrane protein EccD
MSENSPEPAISGQGDHSAGTFAPIAGDAAAQAAGQAAAAGQAGGEHERPPAPIDDLCRLTLCGPDRNVELAVPVHVPLIDMLPALVGHLGEGLADLGLEQGGWVLQRLGDPPLREDLSVASLGLHDGDVVHLRPRADQLPPLDFDDLIDGVAVGISGRPDRWRAETTRRLLTALLAAPLLAAFCVLAAHVGGVSALLAGTMAVALIAVTAAAARAFADLPVTHVVGGAAICFAGLAAGQVPLLRGGGDEAVISAFTLRPALLAAGVAVAGATVAVGILRGGRHPAWAAVVTVALLAAVGGAVATAARLSQAQVAGVLIALIMPVGSWVPVLSFRLAGMRLDPPPSDPEELQSNLEPVPGEEVLDRTRWADRYMTALYGGLGFVAAGCLAVLCSSAGWPARVVAIDVIVLLLLHSRLLVAARQKLAIILPAVAGAVALAVAAGLRADAHSWPVIVCALALVAGLLLTGERAIPGHKFLPHWGRAGDLLHTLTAVAVIPTVLWLLNLYQFARVRH